MTEHQPQQSDEANPMQGYYDWQLTTLMLAYDLVDPIPRGDDELAQQRRDQIAEELGQMVRELLPQEYLDDPSRDFPPEIMMAITRATLRWAMDIAGL